jgi:hypothetical protein
MSARHALPTVLIAAAAAVSSAPAAHCGPWLPAPGHYYSEVRGDYLSASDFNDRLGKERPLAGGGLAQRRALVSYSEFGWKKRIAVILGIPATSVTRRTADGRLNSTSTGLGDLQIGMRFKLSEGPAALAFQVDWGAPAGYDHNVRLTSAEIARLDATTARGLTDGDSAAAVRQQAPASLGLGQQQVTAVALWGTGIEKLNGFLELSHGYRYLGPRNAGQALFGANLGFWVRPKVLLAGRYLGALAVGKGETRADEIEEHLAGPVVVYRIDENMDVFAGTMHPTTARNALRADRYYVGVALKQTGLTRLQGFLGGTRRP